MEAGGALLLASVLALCFWYKFDTILSNEKMFGVCQGYLLWVMLDIVLIKWRPGEFDRFNFRVW